MCVGVVVDLVDLKMRIKIINDIFYELRFKVGNNGIYCVIYVFFFGKEFIIMLDLNVIYCEYVVMGFNDEVVWEIRIIFDDMVEVVEIIIYVMFEYRLGYCILKVCG